MNRIDYLIRNQYLFLTDPTSNSFEENCTDYLNKVFDEYNGFIFKEGSRYDSFLLRMKGALYYLMLDDKQLDEQVDMRLLRMYSLFMNLSYKLCISILYKGVFEDIKSAISDYMGTVQFLDFNKKVDKYKDRIDILKLYNYHMFGFISRIINLVIVKKNDNDTLFIIPELIKQVNEFDIDSPSFEMYEEVISPIDVHVIRYDRKFFFTLSLFLVDENDVDNILNKIIFDRTVYNKDYSYQSITDIINSLTSREIASLGFDLAKYSELKTKVLSKLDTKIQGVIDAQKKEIKQKKVDLSIIEAQKVQIQNEISELEYSDRYNEDDYIEKYFIFSIKYPKRFLIGDKSVHFMTMGMYRTTLVRYFYDIYCNNANIVKLKNLTDIESESTLLLPNVLHSYIYSIRPVKYLNQSETGFDIDLNTRKYKLMWIPGRNPIVLLKDLLINSFIPNNAVEMILKDDIETEKSIDTEVDIKIKYLLKKENTKTSYVIEGSIDYLKEEW